MVQVVNDGNFKTEVLENSGVVLVDFWAEWCGPCQTMLPVLEDFSSEMEGKMTVAKLNVDDSPETAQANRVMSIPTLMVFKDWKAVEQMVGVQDKEKLVEICSKYI